MTGLLLLPALAQSQKVIQPKVTALHEQKLSTPGGVYETRAQEELRILTPADFYRSRKQTAENAKTQREGYWPKSEAGRLLETAKSALEEVDESEVAKDPAVKAVLNQWESMEPRLKAVIQKERELDELLAYMDKLKRVAKKGQEPPPTVQANASQSTSSNTKNNQSRPECANPATRDYVRPSCD
ncbi:MAG: hypothetical protein RI556_12035 [Hydrogenovibrio sp.]|uniref:hypothetical protein n=1 Tax=Hydrogenovibrio sp. TaxID=2065821 RepID=UPI00286FE1E3|nr:hypothetical protein [Hydrogenovibrio sp.]MDR9499897.1 hypothetical protein [Hydrogenovibrio sp.]